MPRLFAGLEIPAEIRESLARLRAPLPGAKWIEPSDFHITLRFAGDVSNPVAAEFLENLGGVDVPVFDMRLTGLGVFGGAEPRSLWAGVETASAFDALARAVERAARGAGLSPAKQGVKPHVTLARLRHSSPEAIARFLERGARFRSAAFAVERFALFSSKPLTGGGPYVIEAAYPLAGSAFDDSDGVGYAWPRGSRDSRG